MLKGSSFLAFSIFLFCSLSVQAQGPSGQQGKRETELLEAHPEHLFSPSAGQKFYEIAYELANSEDISESEAEQAAVLLTATRILDGRANYVLPDLIKLACRDHDRDNSEAVHNLLADYIDEQADLEVAKQAIRYLLEQLNSREQREKLLEEMLKNLGGKNPALELP